MNAYEKLVAELGEAGARAEMKRRRTFAKPENHPGGGFRNKKFAKQASKLGVAARQKNEGKGEKDRNAQT